MSFGTSSTSAIHSNLPPFEANATASRLIELDERPLVGRFDVAHLKSIHWHIFQDVYRWAGELRIVNISKGGHHGRTQREFIRELAVQAGFVIDWRRVTREEMTAASLQSFKTGDSSGMAVLIRLSMK